MFGDLKGMDFLQSPQGMGLLGMAQGLLSSSGASPRPIGFGEAMGNGLQGGISGLFAGHQLNAQQQDMKLREAQAQMQQQELQRKLVEQQKLEETMKQFRGGGNRRDISSALINTGLPGLVDMGLKMAPKVKTTAKGYDASGKTVIHNVYDTGETDSTGITPAEKLMQINQGSQIGLANPYTGQIQSAVGVGMAPGEAARLSQSERHHSNSQALERLKFEEQVRGRIAQQQQPKFQDGYWLTPPNVNNPQGTMSPTPLATAPKGSEMERTKLSGKIAETLGADTEKLIKEATGSGLGSVRDSALGLVGASTDAGEAAGILKMRAATLAGNMPRFEGPQSDADRQYYLQMVGNIGDPSIPAVVKMRSLQELKRIHKIADNNKGLISGGVSPGGAQSTDGWGELK